MQPGELVLLVGAGFVSPQRLFQLQGAVYPEAGGLVGLPSLSIFLFFLFPLP